MLPISAFIICKDEENYVERCIRSVSLCAEIILIDCGSTDSTLDVVERLKNEGFPIRVVTERWRGYGAQKQFALEQCSQEWCLSIDCDERVSPRLANVLPNLISRHDVAGWKFTRYDYLPGFGYISPRSRGRFHVRLFRRGLGAFDPRDRVHEGIRVNGRVERAKHGGLLHFRPLPLSEQILKENNYSTLKAIMQVEAKRPTRPFRIIVSPSLFLLRRYFRHGYWKYGWPGFVRAANGAIYHYLTEAKRYESTALLSTPPVEPKEPPGY